MAIVVEHSTNIASAPETVWGLLINVSSWHTWWKDCVEANTADFKMIHEGSEISMVMQPKHQKMTFQPVVDLCTEGKVLSLTHRSLTIQSTVVWTLKSGPTGARIHIRGVFAGVSVFFMRLLRQDDIFHFSLHGNLRGLKRMAERMI